MNIPFSIYKTSRHIWYLIVSFALLLPSCQWGAHEISLPDEVLAERLLREKPDSLAMILEEQIVLSELSDSARAEYGWWITRLHLRQQRSLVNDTLIHYTLDYYQKCQSPRLPLAYGLVAKQVNWSRDKSEEAKPLFLTGVELAEKRNDTAQLINLSTNLKMLGGDIAHAIEVSKKVIPYTEKNVWNRMINYYMLGCNYGLSGEPDSATYYMTQAIELSQQLKDEKEYYITRNYIDCLNGFGQSDKALPMMRKLEQKFPPLNLGDSIVNTFAYTCIWLNLGRNDSAGVYLDRLDAYCQLMKEEKEKREYSDYKTSIVYVKEILRNAYNARIRQPINMLDIYHFSEIVAGAEQQKAAVERERLFVQNKLERNNLLLKIKEEEGRRFIFYILLIIACLVFFLIYLYQRKLLRKERAIQQMKEQMRLHQIALHENEQLIRQNEVTIELLSARQQVQEELAKEQHDYPDEIEQLRQVNKRLQEEKQKLRQEITRYAQAVPEKNMEMEAYERMAAQNQLFTASTKHLSVQLIMQYAELKQLYNEEVRSLSAIDWPSIYKLMDQVFNYYTKRLRKSFPLLTEEDIQCCCLIKQQLSTSAIARLYGIAPSSVTKRKQRIKERINQTKAGTIGKGQSVDVYLWGF